MMEDNRGSLSKLHSLRTFEGIESLMELSQGQLVPASKRSANERRRTSMRDRLADEIQVRSDATLSPPSGNEALSEAEMGMSGGGSHGAVAAKSNGSLRRSVEMCALSTEAMLDVFAIASAQLPMVATLLEHIGGVADADAVEQVLEAVTKDLLREPDAAREANIRENLKALLPWSRHVPLLREFMAPILKRSKSWKHDETGRVDNPPCLPTNENSELSAELLMLLKRLAFVLEPPGMLSTELIGQMRLQLFGSSTTSSRPMCVINVGAPGSGKSYVSSEVYVPSLGAQGIGPLVNDFMTIDPDFWLTNVCANDNGRRNIANYLNHESFLMATRLRRHMIFDGTGKSLQNTCGRVISRLRLQGYRIHVCIVLASYNECLSNIAERRERTGRDVPARFVQDTFVALRLAGETYIRRQEDLVDEVVLYVNEKRDARVAATVRRGEGIDEALAVLNQYLQMPSNK